jgi:hypothetical protein
MHVTIAGAEVAIEAARKRAIELGTGMCIAIVDSGANLKASHDAWAGSIDIAIKKAKTAVFFGMPAGQIGNLSQPGGSLFGIEHSNEGLHFPAACPSSTRRAPGWRHRRQRFAEASVTHLSDAARLARLYRAPPAIELPRIPVKFRPAWTFMA